MDLEIITERESSPFRHVFPGKYTNGRRYGLDLLSMKKVMKEFLENISLDRNIKTLEIGAGHGQEPSKALLSLGANPFTLDADWNDYCTGIPTTEDLDKIGEAQLYPMLAGKNGITHYLGDVAFIRDNKSQLKDKKFDLLFYWGSIYTGGFCSSIDVSRTATYEFNKDISLKERLEAPIKNVNNKGNMAYISEFFNRTGDLEIHPKNIISLNGDMLDVLLLWANHKNRKPAKVLIFGLNPDFAFEYIKENVIKEKLYHDLTEIGIKEAVNNDTIGNFMTNHRSMFSNYETKDSSEYKRALEIFSPSQQREISKLGLIDCVAVGYKD